MSRPRSSQGSSPIKKVAKFFSQGFKKVTGGDSASYTRDQTDAAAIMQRQIHGAAGRVPTLPAFSDPDTNCLFPAGIRQEQRDGAQGYGQSRPVGKSKEKSVKNLGLHVWAVVAIKDRKVDAQKLRKGKDAKFDASHLCHNSRCINQDHIVVEERAKNEARKFCSGRTHLLIVESDGTERGYDNIVPHVCPHQPACVIKTVRVELVPRVDIEMSD